MTSVHRRVATVLVDCVFADRVKLQVFSEVLHKKYQVLAQWQQSQLVVCILQIADLLDHEFRSLMIKNCSSFWWCVLYCLPDGNKENSL